MEDIKRCEKCNKTLIKKPKGWAIKYCNSCKKEINKDRSRKYQIEHKNRIRIRKPDFINCGYCGNKVKCTVYNKKYCDDCIKKIDNIVSKRWALKHPEQKKAIDKRFLPRKLERNKIDRKQNPDKYKIIDHKKYLREMNRIKKYVRDYHKKYADKIRETKRNYRNSEIGRQKVKLLHNKRRERKQNVIHSFTPEEWITKLNKTNGVCTKCNNYVGIDKLTLDHILPLSLAPQNFVYTIDLVQVMCKSCNSSKYNILDSEEFFKLIVGVSKDDEDKAFLILEYLIQKEEERINENIGKFFNLNNTYL